MPGKCECMSKTHGHIGRCRTTIVPARRGYHDSPYLGLSSTMALSCLATVP